MDEATDLKVLDKKKRGLRLERLTPWLALAALLISVGHIIYAVWRDHINDGQGLLGVLG
jgi:hypothetical protein